MINFNRLVGQVAICVWGLATTAGACADDPAKSPRADPFPQPAANSAAEPLAKTVSLTRSAAFLDQVAGWWTTNRKCGTCHTNYPYLMARPALPDQAAPAANLVRQFFENRVANWDSPDKAARPRNDTEVVATATALAFNDALTTGKLHPLSRKALDRMWTLQKTTGAWEWVKCGWPPFEHDDYFGAVFAAVGVGSAPEGYAQTARAREGLTGLRKYFQKTSAPTLHHKAWLMWASMKLDGLMTPDERMQTVAALLALQRADGGWSLASLGDWKGFDGRPNNTSAPSDGYGTGFVVYVLRQAGLPAGNENIERGVAWLRTHQSESGRWFTRSLNTDKAHYITHAGTAYAVMALKACEK
jgi:squalene-hopene/tetraprenyl-beta-curcumene cyclase